MKTDNKLLSNSDWEYLLKMTPRQFINSCEETLKTREKAPQLLNKILYTCIKAPLGEEYMECLLPKNSVLYRARKYRKEEDLEEKTPDSPFKGYGKEGSFVPPKNKCNEGRVNKKGIRFLYVSNNPGTAIAEIHPQTGSLVSVARIEITSGLFLNILNLALWNIGIDMDEERKSEWINTFILDIAECFYSVNTKEKDYALCQRIGKYAKKMGYDGIAYYASTNASNLDNNAGVNFAIFNYNKCEPVASCLTTVKKVAIEFTSLDL